MVTASKATARVLVAWLIRIGFLFVAALVVVKAATHKDRKIKLLAAHHERLVFIGGSVEMTLFGSGEGLNEAEVNIAF
jgi:hypothetical protein